MTIEKALEVADNTPILDHITEKNYKEIIEALATLHTYYQLMEGMNE